MLAFAEGGYRGTTTEEVARRAGISQPYIFRLFDSKLDLFVAVVKTCFERTQEVMESAAQGLTGEDALQAMGQAYQDLVRDPVALLVEMHAFTTAVYEPEVRRAAQDGMRRIWLTAERASGADGEALRYWLATGMLLNVTAALGLEQLDEPWAVQASPMGKECTFTDGAGPGGVGRE